MSSTPFQAPDLEHLAELMPQYDIEDFIAQGGMGAVYKGRQRSLDRDVAIKILPKELGDSEFRKAFATEAKAMARLNHPNLLSVFEFGEIDGMPYIVMEYVHGESLYGASHNQAIDSLQSVEIVKGICDGLAHAHENNIVHRDIKPSNILLTLSAKPKIGDFGLAHAADSDQPGLMMGTPGYTAPEVFEDPDQAGPLADIYSVGVILHQLLTGIDPSGCMEPPTYLTGNNHLDAIWSKAVSADPTKRYQTIASMAADLEKWATTKTTSTTPASGTPKPVSGAPKPVSGAPKPVIPSARPAPVTARRNGSGFAIAKWFIVAILAAVTVFTYQLLQENREDIKKGIAIVNGYEPEGGTTLPPVPETPPVTQPEPAPTEVTSNVPSTPPVIKPETQPKEITSIEISEPPFKEPETPPDVALNPKPETKENLPPGDPELLKRAVGLIGDARKKRDKKLAENASSLIFKLGSLIRDNKKDEGPSIDDFKKNIVNNRIPEVDDSSDPSDKFNIQLKQALASESSIDNTYNTDLTKIRDSYVSRLTTAAKDASDTELKQRLTDQAALAKDLTIWTNQLAPEPAWTRVKMNGIFSSDSVLGKWIEHSGEKDAKWIAHPDGRLEIVGQKWIATWKLTEDKIFSIQFEGKDKSYDYKREGDIWVGCSEAKMNATLTRGDW